MEKENIDRGREFEGSTVDVAIKKALEVLEVSREAICVKIICEEKRGLFGMAGAKPAKIKVTLKKNGQNEEIKKID